MEERKTSCADRLSSNQDVPLPYAMSCEFASINRFFVVRWSEPTVEDVARVRAELDRATQVAGRPLVFLAVIPENTVPPAANVRKAMDGALARSCSICDSVHFIVEGGGFKHSILRTILAANILTSGRRGKVFVSSSAEEAVGRSPADRRMEFTTAIIVAGTRGLVTTTLRFRQEAPNQRRPTV